MPSPWATWTRTCEHAGCGRPGTDVWSCPPAHACCSRPDAQGARGAAQEEGGEEEAARERAASAQKPRRESSVHAQQSACCPMPGRTGRASVRWVLAACTCPGRGPLGCCCVTQLRMGDDPDGEPDAALTWPAPRRPAASARGAAEPGVRGGTAAEHLPGGGGWRQQLLVQAAGLGAGSPAGHRACTPPPPPNPTPAAAPADPG
jgi:hypothetical protein